jgi:uncharacterized protein
MLVTYTGKHFDFHNITKELIYFPDIFHSLPKLNRFVGHSIRPYSVGEHTFIGLMMAEKMGYTPLQKLHWFIHDFTEAYVGDCPAPLKKLIPQFSEYEEKVENAILERLGLKPLTDEELHLVKRIDFTMLVLEMRDLTLHDWENFIDDYTYLEVLNDDDFKISQQPFDTNELARILEHLFNNLMEEVANA